MLDVKAGLELARSGHRDAALHHLLELGEAALPPLADAYRAERDPDLRALIAEAAWRLRAPAAFDVLAEILQDPHPDVWRQALDGLVALASPESLRILESARDWAEATDAEGRADFRDWVEGTIEDVRGRVNE